jgi:hypothetical protein
MASIEKLALPDGQKRYRVRWRTPDGKSRSKTMKREVDAKKFLTGIEHAKDTNS